MAMRGVLCLLMGVLGIVLPSLAQQAEGPGPDSTQARIKRDSAVAYAPKQVVDSARKANNYWGKPQKAALYSALLPGAGQVYNREIWKVPILYAGIGTIAYLWHNNGLLYYRFDRILQRRNAVDAGLAPGQAPVYTDEFVGLYDKRQLIQIRDGYRRNRDLTVIVSALVYLLQIADAHVFAHLKGFNINDDLALRPAALPPTPGQPGWALQPGASLTWTLR